MPPGTEVALARVLLAIDREGAVHPTSLVEDLQLRIFRYVDGAEHPDTDSGFGQNLYQYEMRRTELFEGSKCGGLVRVANDEPRPSFATFPFTTLATAFKATQNAAGYWGPLKSGCIECHQHEQRVQSFIDGTRRPFPDGYPFGKASLRSLSFARVYPVEGGAPSLAHAVIDWKEGRDEFMALRTLMAEARRNQEN
jgi:hypothetical protein